MDPLPLSHEQFVKDELGEFVKTRFEMFLHEFSFEGVQSYYIDRIRIMREADKTTLPIDFQHVVSFDEELAEGIESKYYRVEPYLLKTLQKTVKRLFPDYVIDEQRGDREFYISFYNHRSVYGIRELRSHLIGRLCSLRGTVTRTSEVRPELLYGSFICLDCKTPSANILQQFKYTEPVGCKNSNCQNNRRWQLNIENSQFIDWQKIRVQENTNEIPSGSMPRTLDIILRNEEVEKAKAGDKSIFTGTLIAVPDMSRGRAPGPKVEGQRATNSNITESTSNKGDFLGFTREYNYKLCFLATCVLPADTKVKMDDTGITEELDLTQEEMEIIKRMKTTPKIYKKLVDSIAPTVFGHREVKKGILLMLFGGVHKVTMEGINLRGDINVCIVGDPSTSKSQFLKYVTSFLPRAVYTSGKASSAAGLTATVVKDPDTNDFNIEAGALMLADNGICCIDEFDKMDTKDQVAIHEAMEQQTISIAKAGIHATLNARASILAAANPIGGRYDKAKTLKANLNISPAIMSRFDLFFVVLDECDENTDKKIAEHIVSIHQRKDEALRSEFSTHELQTYIKYAKTIKPKMTPAASKLLVENYRKLRQSDIVGHGKTAYRITVRQLESMIRLSEALARIHCDDWVLPEYVAEAAQLLRKSIIHVETSDVIFDATDLLPSQPQQPQHDSEDSADEGKSSKDVSIPFAKYNQVTDLIVWHLRNDAKETGKSQGSLINWYIEQIKDEITDAEELKFEAGLVPQIIDRLVSVDNVLIVTEESQTGDVNDRILSVHPNYDPDK